MDLRHRAPIATVLVAALLALAACGGGSPPPRPGTEAASSEAVTRVGDVSIRASVVQTSLLNDAVARDYGITPDPGVVLLLVAVRRGPDAEATAEPAQVTATATGLRGDRQVVAMREVQAGGLTDYIGTVTTSLPETLRFDITVVRAGGARSTLQLTRDFYPQ